MIETSENVTAAAPVSKYRWSHHEQHMVITSDLALRKRYGSAAPQVGAADICVVRLLGGNEGVIIIGDDGKVGIGVFIGDDLVTLHYWSGGLEI